MSYYVLPNIFYNINENNLKINFTKKKMELFINKNLHKYLNKEKQRIQNYPQDWDIIKKYRNPYEFINSIIPNIKRSICKYKPLSRAFFKMIEICNTFKLLDKLKKVNIKSFHLAEGPGGFIEALLYLRKNENDIYYGMTLINDKDTNVPGWKKSSLFLKTNPNVIIETGADKKGDLYNPDNLLYCMQKYSNSMDIITGDGGFDFSINYEKQENMAFRLIFSQIAFAITMQKKEGIFILKIFDIFLQPSIELIYLLSCFYTKVSIIKPNTSRYANSEKYIVCENFKFQNTKKISEKFHSILTVLSKMDLNIYKISSIINIPIQYIYLLKIKEINVVLGQQQIETITNTINLIEQMNNQKTPYLKEKNIQKCINWCHKNNMPYNKILNSGIYFS